MKSFDPNYIHCFSKKTIKLTFQQMGVYRDCIC
nr:DUF5406 family protein [Lactobacillus taiwanensis]